MKRLIEKLITSGANLSTRKALKSTLNILGIKPENVDRLYVDLKNSTYKNAFRKVPRKDRVLFLPQCLRNSKKCRAELTESGYKCRKCGACKISEIKQRAEKLGYRVFIIPGAEMTLNIMRKTRPKAVVGVACLKELVIAAEGLRIPGQGVELLRDGCADTDVELENLFKVLEDNK